MQNRIALLAFVAALLTGCSGTVKMSPLSPEAINQQYTSNSETEGLIVYRAIQLVEVDQLTQINVPGGGGAAASTLSGQCKRVLSRKIVTVADWQHPYRLHYDHGFLETYTFAATLTADGILSTINSQSTPDQGKTIDNLLTAATGAATLAKTLSVVPPPPVVAANPADCTVTPIFLNYEQLPAGAIKPFGTTQ